MVHEHWDPLARALKEVRWAVSDLVYAMLDKGLELCLLESGFLHSFDEQVVKDV